MRKGPEQLLSRWKREIFSTMAKRKEAEPEPSKGGRALISVEIAARLLKLTSRRVQQLVKEGWIKQAKRGEYTVLEVVHGYIDFRDEVDRSAQQKSANTRVSDKRAEEIELRIARDTRALQEDARAEAIAVTDIIIGGIRTDLLALPARFTADLTQRRKLETLIDDVLRAAAKRTRDEANGSSEGGGDSDPGAEDDA